MSDSNDTNIDPNAECEIPYFSDAYKKLDFKFKELPNIKFSHAALLEYYETITKEFQYLKWEYAMLGYSLDYLGCKLDGVYSWALHIPGNDVDSPQGPFQFPHSEEAEFRTPTALIFGEPKKILDLLPNPYHGIIVAHPPGCVVHCHYDNPGDTEEEFIKIHIPIKTNDNAYFLLDGDEINFKVGSVYLVNTSLLHGCRNDGDSDRIHLIITVPLDKVEEIINLNVSTY